MTLPLTMEGTWSWDFAVPEGWALVSILSSAGDLPSTQRSGWDHVTVLLQAETSASPQRLTVLQPRAGALPDFLADTSSHGA